MITKVKDMEVLQHLHEIISEVLAETEGDKIELSPEQEVFHSCENPKYKLFFLVLSAMHPRYPQKHLPNPKPSSPTSAPRPYFPKQTHTDPLPIPGVVL